MRKVHSRTFVGVGLLFLFSIVLFVGVYSQASPNSSAPQTSRGLLDLSNWDLRSQGPVTLDGEWEFYEGELLDAADFKGLLQPTASYLTVPGTWRGHSANGGMSRNGFGTYRLTIRVEDADEVLGVKIKSIRMAHRLYINGQLEGQSGEPSFSIEGYKPRNTPYTAFFHSDSREIELIIQTMNYSYFTGGIVNSIQFGQDDDISKLNNIQAGTDLAMILTMGVFGAYHLSIYFLGRREKAYLLSGLYVLQMGLYRSIYGEKILLQMFPNIPFDIAYKLLEISQFLGCAIIVVFFYSVESRYLSRAMLKLILSPIVLYLAMVVALPYEEHIRFKYIFILYIGAVSIFNVSRLVYLAIRSWSDSDARLEQLLFIGGAVSLAVYLFSDSLYAENIIKSDLVGKCGVIGFLVFMNILLAVRFSRSYERVAVLSSQLAVSNQLKDEFLMNTSHELKTPLNGIMNLTSHLLEDAGPSMSPKHLQNLWLIKDTSIKLSMLIHDLMDVTHLKYGELRMQLSIVDLRMTTQIVLDMLQFELEGREVRLENLVEAGVGVLADENRLRQVLYNLVHNAIRHTEIGFVTVSAAVVENMVKVLVEDTGTGISKDKHEAIFGYFEQLEERLPRDGYVGMGLGL